MKKTIEHRFSGHKINPNTEILIVGTFNPETPKNVADFFYGRERNFLWRLLPTAFQYEDLKGAIRGQKEIFIADRKIDFIDLIQVVEVDEEREADYADAYIDKHVIEWTDVIALIETLNNLKKVVVTRKTFSDVPKMKERVELIKEHCLKHNIGFECLPTPARFYSQAKQQIWTKAFSL